MSLQKEAFHLVVGFMGQGLEADLGGLNDMLATMTSSRLADRRQILHGIGTKFQRVADMKLYEWDRLHQVVEDAYNEACALVNHDPDLVEEPTQEQKDNAVRTWKNLRERQDRLGQFFNCEDITGRSWFMDEFHYRVLRPTFAKWMRL